MRKLLASGELVRPRHPAHVEDPRRVGRDDVVAVLDPAAERPDRAARQARGHLGFARVQLQVARNVGPVEHSPLVGELAREVVDHAVVDSDATVLDRALDERPWLPSRMK